MKVKVLQRFHDRTDYRKVYEVGDMVEVSEPTRVADLVANGIVEQVKNTDTKKTTTKADTKEIEINCKATTKKVKTPSTEDVADEQ